MSNEKSYILVTGGAGYIGSHTVKLLVSANYHVVVVDNLIYGHKEAIPSGIPIFVGDIGDKEFVRTIFQKYNIESVLHFAAYASVGESVVEPLKYYQNNVAAPLNLLEVMLEYGCKQFIFSSTCATYGNPQYVPMDEKHPQAPINPYGQSKLDLEKIIKDFHAAYGLNYVFLRYFNASGASDDASIGEDHTPETHLIPLVLEAAQGKRASIAIFGTDYPTADGTCVRDYIHVNDLGEAHISALHFLKENKGVLACNLGTGKGYSVKEVIEAAEKVTGLKIPVTYGDRREGDPPQLVANPSYSKEKLGWEAKHKDIKTIIESAWKWHNGPKKGRY